MQRRSLIALGLLPLLGAAPAQGRTMASGRPFDQRAMTAASTRFPLGSRVRVTDLATRKSVLVTITDVTIPNSRVLIDLSHAAGRALGIEEKGRARVEVVPVGFDRGQARRRHGQGRGG